MANYSVASGDHAVHDKTLAAGTVDTVQFADDCRKVEIVSNGTASLYVTVDGSTPTVSGPKTYIMPAGGPMARVIESPDPKATVVQLISAGTPTYSVSREP